MSFFCSSFYFLLYISSLISTSIARVGLEGFTLCPDPIFHHSSPSFVLSFFFLFLTLDAVIEVKLGMGRRRRRFLEDEREWRLGFCMQNDLVLCGE